MVEFLVVLVTVTPMSLGAIHGFRAGGSRLIAKWGALLLVCALGSLATTLSFRARWFEPLGLATPLLLGLLTAGVGWAALHRVAKALLERRPSLPSSRGRLLGAVTGLVGGAVVASSLWVLLLVADGLFSVDRFRFSSTSLQATGQLMHSLVRTANRGFLRHLPVVAPMSDEVEALLFILNADVTLCDRLVHERGWEELQELPSLQAILDDPEIFADLDAVASGNLSALYRLQKNPKVIAFVEEEEIQAVLPELRPSLLARQLEELAKRRFSYLFPSSDPEVPSSPSTAIPTSGLP